MESLAYYILNMTYYYSICFAIGYLFYKSGKLRLERKITERTHYKFVRIWIISFCISQFCIMLDVSKVFFYYGNAQWCWFIWTYGAWLVLSGLALNYPDVGSRIYSELEKKGLVFLNNI